MSRSDARPLLACAGAQVQPPFCPFTRGTWPVIRSLQARKERYDAPSPVYLEVLKCVFSKGHSPTFKTRAMVHAFLIHTLRAAKAEEGLCRVLYSCFFGAENSPNDPQPHGAERDRLLRKEQILAVARQVESMFQLQQQACGRHAVDLQPQSSDDLVALHEAPCGVFRLAPGDPFQEPRTVVWLGVLSIGFALVLDTHENLLLVESTLRLLARLLLDHLRLLVPGGANLLLRADYIEGILTRFLPHGQLLFLNDQFVQGLEKEFSAAWSH